jgi:two-component system, NarL family, response regulator NreC
MSAVARTEGDPTGVTTVVVAEKLAIVRGAVTRLLENEPGLVVVAEALDVPMALRKVLAYKPCVLVLDLHLPGGSALGAIPKMLGISPGTRIVVLTSHDEPWAAREALRAGASGFALKQASDRELTDAVGAVAAGQGYLDPELAGRTALERELEPGCEEGLSARELDVLRLIGSGYTNPEIGECLHLSMRTVEAHRLRLRRKINRRTRAEITAYAREMNLVG